MEARRLPVQPPHSRGGTVLIAGELESVVNTLSKMINDGTIEPSIRVVVIVETPQSSTREVARKSSREHSIKPPFAVKPKLTTPPPTHASQHRTHPGVQSPFYDVYPEEEPIPPVKPRRRSSQKGAKLPNIKVRVPSARRRGKGDGGDRREEE